MRKISDLGATEIRILGALLEKEQATPDYYPLTMSSLVAACNQKSNRDPVTSLTAGEIAEVLEALRRDVLVWRGRGPRSENWSQSVSRRLELDAEEKAVLTLLILRGPQTAGELRGRSQRLHTFTSVEQVEAALERLAATSRELVLELERRPGQKERRWMHRLSGEGAEDYEPAPAPVAGRQGKRSVASPLEVRVAALEARLERLEEALKGLIEEPRGLDPEA